LRTRVLVGELALADEQKIIAGVREWLESKAPAVRGFQLYLERWGDWKNPWKA
jgi:hypothetical protein